MVFKFRFFTVLEKKRDFKTFIAKNRDFWELKRKKKRENEM